MKKILSVLLVTVIIICSFSIGASASFNSLMETESDIVLLVNTDSETVILDKNAGKRTAPASLTKIVTCMLVLENCPDLSVQVTCKRECLNGLYAMNAATAGIVAGESLSIENLLYCLMLPSAADAVRGKKREQEQGALPCAEALVPAAQGAQGGTDAAEEFPAVRECALDWAAPAWTSLLSSAVEIKGRNKPERRRQR